MVRKNPHLPHPFRRPWREFEKEFRVNPNNELFCILCNTTVNCDKRFRVEKHRDGAKHQNFLSLTQYKKPSQTFLPVTKNDFKTKIVEAFIAADIPLFKLQNARIRGLFTDLGQPLPSESACRAHVDNLTQADIERLKQYFNKGKNIFMVFDESNINNTNYVNILMGDTSVPEKTFVVKCSEVATVNKHVVAVMLDDALRKLEIQREKFVLLLSDSASYMTAGTAALKLLYTNLFHVTCTAHLLHNCAEKVRSHFPDVDDLIARIKAATLKNKTRRQLFEHIGSPPQPVVTRWGSWLQAAFFYADYFLEVKSVVNRFEGQGILVVRAKEAVNSSSVMESLMKIKRDYMNLPKIIEKLESTKCTMNEAYTELTTLDMKQDCVAIGAYIKKRLRRNGDLEAIVKMQRVGVSPSLYAELQCCQPTSASVERSFSVLARLLRKDRPFLPSNAEKYLSLHYNKL